MLLSAPSRRARPADGVDDRPRSCRLLARIASARISNSVQSRLSVSTTSRWLSSSGMVGRFERGKSSAWLLPRRRRRAFIVVSVDVHAAPIDPGAHRAGRYDATWDKMSEPANPGGTARARPDIDSGPVLRCRASRCRVAPLALPAGRRARPGHRAQPECTRSRTPSLRTAYRARPGHGADRASAAETKVAGTYSNPNADQSGS